MKLSEQTKQSVLQRIADLRTLLDQTESAVRAEDDQQIIETLNFDIGIPPMAYTEFYRAVWELGAATMFSVEISLSDTPEVDQEAV